MHLSKGEYTGFSLNGKLNLLNQFGTLLNEKYADDVEIKIYQLYDFYVEVLYNKQCVIKAEPLTFPGLVSYYL